MRWGWMVACAAAGWAAAGGGMRAAAQDASGAALVAGLHAVFGEHHARAVHAKGIVLEGSFTPTAEAAQLSTAAVFAGGAVPVTARFSDFAGIPAIPDTDPNASPRGFAVRFTPASGDGLDLVTHSFNGFPVPTAAEFGVFVHALAASGAGAPKPTPLDTYLAAHPVAKTFLTAQIPPPVSYATVAYFGVNAMTLSGPRGQTVVRLRWVPGAGQHSLDPAALAGKGPDYLADEIRARLAQGPVTFDLVAQLAGAGDRADDPSVAWPESRRQVRLGTVTLTRLAADQAGQDKALVFLPGNLPPGMAAADPMLQVRSEAYAVSGSERQ